MRTERHVGTYNSETCYETQNVLDNRETLLIDAVARYIKKAIVF